MVPGGEPMPWPPEDPRFTEPARRALGFAQDEAARLNHNHLGAPHIFVGVVREPEGRVAPLLARVGVTLERARTALATIMGSGGQPIASTDITLGLRGQRVMEFARHEARRLHHDSGSTEHLLLAAVHEQDGMMSQILERLGLSEERVTAEALSEMNVPFTYRLAENATSTEGPYDNFDAASTRVLRFAQEEAARNGYGWVSAQDLALGLARIAETGESEIMRRTFEELAITTEQLRDVFPKAPAPQQPVRSESEIRLPASVKLIIEHAIYEAGRDRTVRPEHILLAIGTSQDSFANYGLRKLGATPERIRDTIARTRE